MAAADSRDSGAKNKGYLSALWALGLEDLPHPTLALANAMCCRLLRILTDPELSVSELEDT